VAVGVPLGEIRADQLRVLARVSRRYGNGDVHFTKDQDVELHWVPIGSIQRVVRALEGAGLSLKGKKSTLQLQACPGTEFCVLAVTNAQGAAREILKEFTPKDSRRAELLRGLSIHISGCPNSCAKHQVADIGFAGTMVAVGEERRYSYMLYLGGCVEGKIQIGEVVRKGITEEMIVPTVEVLLDLVLEYRELGESFSEVIARLGTERVSKLLEERLTPFVPHEVDKITMIPEMVEV
jgi:sulfite reductase beta subunit-like hemoprotein